MSEYQYVHFIALDRPLDEKQLDYMEKQSSRAEITKREFTNEYNFSEFRGNSAEMMRRGYDVHLHFANYGIRRLMFRLPAGLPWDEETLSEYLPECGVEWHPDKKGPGGILEIDPESDGGTFDSYVTDIEEVLEEIAPIRDLLIAGDLRPLYVIWLAMTAIHGGDEAEEPPLPAGMRTLPDCVFALADFYEISEDLLEAAGEGSSPAPKSTGIELQTKAWLGRQSKEELRKIVERVLEEDAAIVRAETLAAIRSECGSVNWPTTESTRTIDELLQLATKAEARRLKRKADAKVKARVAKLKKLAANPDATLLQIEKLIHKHSKSGYEEAAETLANLGEALGAEGPARVQAEAKRLVELNPTLRKLISELKKRKLLIKSK